MAVKVEQQAAGAHAARPQAARPGVRPAGFAPAARGGGRRPRSGPGARRLPAACALPGRRRAAPWRPAHPSRARHGQRPLADGNIVAGRAIGTGVRLAVPDPACDARPGCDPGAAAERPGYGGPFRSAGGDLTPLRQAARRALFAARADLPALADLPPAAGLPAPALAAAGAPA